MRVLRFIGGIIVFFWIAGLALRIAGKLIHLLLIIAVLVFLYDFFFGRRF